MPTTPDINSDDYYKVLGVDRGASDNEINRAYKKLALKHHPDKNPDDPKKAEENFKLITEAYEVLHDAGKRDTYNQFGKQASGGGGGPGGVSFQHADDLFRTFFGGNDPFSVFFDKDDDDGPGSFFRQGGMPGGGGGTRVQFGGMPGGMGGMEGLFGGMGGMPGMGKGFGGMPGMGKGMGKGGGRPPPKPAPPPHAMPVGTRVSIRGLNKAQEHNGKTGRVTGFDASKGRYEVELEDDTTLSLKPANLTQQCSVRLRGIESQASLNDQEGTILSYNDDNGRYNVKLKAKMENGRDVVGLQPVNLVLDKGTRVVTQGLGKEEFNGLMAQITDYDAEAQRYQVMTENGKAIKIKLDNVLC